MDPDFSIIFDHFCVEPTCGRLATHGAISSAPTHCDRHAPSGTPRKRHSKPCDLCERPATKRPRAAAHPLLCTDCARKVPDTVDFSSCCEPDCRVAARFVERHSGDFFCSKHKKGKATFPVNGCRFPGCRKPRANQSINGTLHKSVCQRHYALYVSQTIELALRDNAEIGHF